MGHNSNYLPCFSLSFFFLIEYSFFFRVDSFSVSALRCVALQPKSGTHFPFENPKKSLYLYINIKIIFECFLCFVDMSIFLVQRNATQRLHPPLKKKSKKKWILPLIFQNFWYIVYRSPYKTRCILRPMDGQSPYAQTGWRRTRDGEHTPNEPIT